MRALVTGAAGFIGSHLVDRLLADPAVSALLGLDNFATGKRDNLSGALSEERFTLLELDITTAELFPAVADFAPDVVFHLAAQMDVRKSVADPLYDTRTNVLGTVNVLEAAVRSCKPRIVFTSSGGTVYGEPATLPVREDAPLLPAAPYGAAKSAGETYCAAFARLYDLTVASLRLGNVYGPRQDPHGEAGVVAIFGNAMTAGTPTKVFGDGSSMRDYVYVDDVVAGLLAALELETSPAVYNVSSGVGTTVRELHTVMAGLAGVPDEPQLEPVRAGELQAIHLDVTALQHVTDWRPTMDLEPGLALTYEWIRTSLG